jgi:hypothetical protein
MNYLNELANMLQNQTNSGLAKISLLIQTYFIKYIAYSALTFAVGSILSIILVILITISGPNLSFPFLKYFSFLVPVINQESFSLNLDDIMKIYLYLTLILIIIIEIAKYLLKKIFNLKITISFAKELIINAAIITIVYLIAILIIPQMKIAAGQDRNGFYLIFIIFYFVALITSSIYLTLNKITDKLYSLLNN